MIYKTPIFRSQINPNHFAFPTKPVERCLTQRGGSSKDTQYSTLMFAVEENQRGTDSSCQTRGR